MYKLLLAATLLSGLFAAVPAFAAANECQQTCVQEQTDCLQGCKDENGAVDPECKQMCAKSLQECHADCSEDKQE